MAFGGPFNTERPAGGVCRSVGRTYDGHRRRKWRRNRSRM